MLPVNNTDWDGHATRAEGASSIAYIVGVLALLGFVGTSIAAIGFNKLTFHSPAALFGGAVGSAGLGFILDKPLPFLFRYLKDKQQ